MLNQGYNAKNGKLLVVKLPFKWSTKDSKIKSEIIEKQDVKPELIAEMWSISMQFSVSKTSVLVLLYLPQNPLNLIATLSCFAYCHIGLHLSADPSHSAKSAVAGYS